jgi:predicted NBD/HSP70 family sugar kinase
MGDKTCGGIVEQVGNYLGLGLANLVNVINPSVIVLDKRLELAGPGLIDQIAKIVRIQALKQSTEKLDIRFGTLDTEAAVIGMCLIILEKHFEIPALRPPWFLIESLPLTSSHHSVVSGSNASARRT